MKTQKIKKIMAFALMLVLVLSLLPVREHVSAAAKPAKPKITLTLSKDKASATLTIKKTKRAEGYQIMVKLPGAKKFTELTTLELDGKQKRSFTIGNATSGKYTVKVRGYAVQNGKTVYGKYSKAKAVTIENSNAIDLGIEQGDIVTFGSFEQDADTENGKEPIEWIVLSNDNGKLFMVSVFALERGIIDDNGYSDYDYEDWDDEWEDEDGEDAGNEVSGDKVVLPSFDGTWKNSQLRKHLNEEFIKEAFNDTEISYIADTVLEDSGCTDKVFLLSKDEVNNKAYGFKRDADRTCAPTASGLKNGIYTFDDDAYYGYMYAANEGKTPCYWWLRTAKGSGNEFYIVEDGGEIGRTDCWGGDYYTGRGDDEEAYYADGEDFAVRPAIVVEVKGGIQNLLKKTGKTMKKEWENAGVIEEFTEDVEYIDAPNPKIVDISKAKKGDAVLLGSYEQDGNKENGKEPIEWIVLSRTDDELLVLSRYVLDAIKIDDHYADSTWENCTLRKWLNDTFYNESFTKKEQKKIKTTTLNNTVKNSERDEKETKDKIFLLSFEEATNPDYGFKTPNEVDELRAGVPTDALDAFLEATGGDSILYDWDHFTRDNKDLCDWWLRSFSVEEYDGEVDTFVSFIDDFVISSVWKEGITNIRGVRPAMVISLKN